MLAFIRLLLLLATVAAAVIAGLPSLPDWGFPAASPYFDPVLSWVHKAVGRELSQSSTILYGTTGLIAAVVLLLAALPAAILAKLMPRDARPFMTRVFWLAATVAIAWPALVKFITRSEF